MRSAISPRLAIRIFSKLIGGLLDNDERLVEFDRLAVIHQHRFDRSANGCSDRVHNLHRLHDQQRIARLYLRSEEHTSELQSLMRISYAVFCLKKKQQKTTRERKTT